MADEQQPTSIDRELVTKIVTAYVRRNQVAADVLSALIMTVHEALARLAEPPAEEVGERTPAVSIRRSVHRDYVVCLDCGWRGSMLKRHLTTAHALNLDAYRVRWNLPHDHRMIAPEYSERRSGLAKQLGLGQRDRGAAKAAAPAPAPKRRGRPRATATPS